MINSILIAIVCSCLVVLASTSQAALATIEKSALITLEGYQTQGQGHQACEALKKSLAEWSSYTQPAARCLYIKDNQRAQLTAWARSQPEVGFIVSLRKGVFSGERKKPTSLEIHVLSVQDQTEPEHLRWEIRADEDLPSVQKILKKYSDFDAQKNEIKRALLLHGLSESTKIKTSRSAEVVSTENGRPLSFEEAYQIFLNENKIHKNYLAAGLEIAATLGIGTTLYYLAPEEKNVNSEDWDYNSKTSLKARFFSGEAHRFDDNAFNTNRNHYFAGVGYYSLAREAGLSRLESLLMNAAASSFWEFVSEYREVVSINDQINTTLGGFVIGEALHQVIKIFAARPNTGINRIFRGVFNSPQRMSAWLERKADANSPVRKNLFSDLESKPDIWAKLDFYAGLTRVHGNSTSIKTVGFDSQVYNVPMFEEPGRVQTLLMDDTVFSRLSAENGSGLNLSTFKLYAKTTLAAIYDKRLGRTEQGHLQGYNLIVGPSMGVEINEEVASSPVLSGSDQQGLVHVLGGTVDLVIYHNGIRLHCVIDVFGDFAMMRSYAFESYAAQHGAAGVQSVIQKRGYYYGDGTTQSLSVIADYEKWELGARYQNTWSQMINSRSRFYEGDDSSLTADDQIENTRVWVAYQLNTHLRLEAGLEKIIRQGQMGNTTVSSSDLRKYGRLVYSY